VKYPAIILARGGSKGLPGKNILSFAGRPLFVWSILQAKQAKRISDVYVSSDCPEILSLAEAAGAWAIRRPKLLATDMSSSESGWLHALHYLQEKHGQNPQLLVALQATSPVREAGDIDQAVKTFEKEKADSLFSACSIDDITLWQEKDRKLKAITYDPINRGRRQDRKPFLLENGSIYIFKSKLLKKTNNRLGEKNALLEMPLWKSFEIDDKDSFELCQTVFMHKKFHLHKNIINTKPELIIYDFDGVMTNNRVLVTENGEEAVWVSRSDGWGIQELREGGFKQIILSTEKNRVVAARAKKLRIEVFQGVKNKGDALKKICLTKRISPQKVLFVGNDANDIPAMCVAGMTAAPADAHPTVLSLSNLVTQAKGGQGVIREISEILLQKS
jgi:N-acylneuraminate cytidylyltransferase